MENVTQTIPQEAIHENEEYASSTRAVERQKMQKHNLIVRYVIKLVLLVWTCMCFARVPFIGSYLDGLIEYVLGYGKYVFYIGAIFIQIGFIFNFGYTRIVKTKRFIVFGCLGLLSVCCIVSGVNTMVHNFNQPLTFTEIMSNYHSSWFDYFKTWDYQTFANSGYISGGILAELISYIFNFLSYVVLIVLAVIILLISVFIIFNINYQSNKLSLKLRGWMIRKLGGTFKYDGYNELKSTRENQNKFKKAKRSEIESIALQSEAIPFKLLPDSDVNKHGANFKRVRNIQNKLAVLFSKNKINCTPTDINVYTAYSEITFEAHGKTDIQAIINMQQEIAKVAKVEKFNFSLHGNIVNIELENVYFSKFSLKTVFDMYDLGKDVNAVFGLDKQNKLCMQDFRKEPSAIILGKKGSGAATLTVLMALSTCYITSPEDLELVVLNPNCEATFSSFVNLPHTCNQVYETVGKCTKKLLDIQKVIEERNKLLKQTDASSIDQYNRSKTVIQPQLKHLLVLLPNFDSIIKESFQNTKLIADILNDGPKAGVYLILQSYSVNNDIVDKQIYDNVSQKYILALGTQEESLIIFDNYRGQQLHGNGDCLHYGSKITNMERIQICNLNYTELTSDIDIIKTFYLAKQRQKEAQILSKGKNNETN